MAKPGSRKIFKPRNSRLTNFVLLFSGVAIIVGMLHLVHFTVVYFVMIIVDVAAVAVWFGWAQKYFTVTLSEGNVTGPGKGLESTMILLQDVDVDKMHGIVDFKRMFGYFRIPSKTGDEIRLYCRLLTSKQIEKIYFKIQEAAAGFSSSSGNK